MSSYSEVNINGISICVRNNEVFINDRKVYTGTKQKPNKELVFDKDGNINGDVTGNIIVKGNNVKIKIEGDVIGNITGGDIIIEGDHIGNSTSCRR